MPSKTVGYVLGGLQVVAGIVLTAVGLGGLGVPLIVSGAGTIAGTALTPTPPRTQSLRDSPTYGIDQFENPRGPEALIAILFGTHRVKPVVLMESVSSIAENNSPGVDVQKRQGVKWLGAVCEGVISDLTDVWINDRPVLSDLLVDQVLGTGNGSKKEFSFPHRWVYLGDDENPAIEVRVDGVVKSYSTKSGTASFTMPMDTKVRTFDLRRDDKRERILEGTVRVYLRGPGYPEVEQLRRTGLYRWGLQKLTPYKVRLKFQTRPATGYVARVTYDYLGTEGLGFAQDLKGNTRVVFGAAPANGKKVTATYRTTPFPGLRLQWRPGTLDQAPIEGFTDLEQSRNPRETLLSQNAPVSYSTDGREVDDLRVGIVAPRGFIYYKDDGGTNPVGAKVRVEYRKTGAATWTTLRCASGTEFTLTAERPSTVRWEIGLRTEWKRLFDAGDTDAADRLEAFDRAAYEVRITRLDKPSTDPLIADELHFQVVTEVLHEGFVYPGTSLLAIEAMPSEFLSGGSIRVSCLATRGPLGDPRSDALYGHRSLGDSANPFLALRDLITSGEGAAKERYGGGFFFTGMDFFLGVDGRTAGTPPSAKPLTDGAGFIAALDFADEWIHRPGDDATKAPYTATYGATPPYASNNGERRCRLNVVLDTPQSLMETVGDLAFLGYCFASLQGARWRFPLDQDGEPAFTFVDEVDPPGQNASKIVLHMEAWGRTPTAVQGSFWNEVINYERDELLYPVGALPEGTPTNTKEVDLRGVTRETEAARMLRHLAEQAKALPLPVSWESHPGVQHVEAGDIVALKTRVPYSTGVQAMEVRVRVLACMVGRDEDGKLAVRYAGRVMKSSVYALKPVSVGGGTSGGGASRGGGVDFGTPGTGLPGRPRTGGRILTDLRARVS